MKSPRFGGAFAVCCSSLAVIIPGSAVISADVEVAQYIRCCITCRAAHVRRLYQCKFQAQWCVLSAQELPESAAAGDGDAARQRWLGFSGAPLLQGTRRQAPVRYAVVAAG